MTKAKKGTATKAKTQKNTGGLVGTLNEVMFGDKHGDTIEALRKRVNSLREQVRKRDKKIEQLESHTQVQTTRIEDLSIVSFQADEMEERIDTLRLEAEYYKKRFEFSQRFDIFIIILGILAIIAVFIFKL